MQARAQQRFFSDTNRFAKTEDDSPLLRSDLVSARYNKPDNHECHHDFNNRETAAQRFGQRLGTGVLRCRGIRLVVVVVMFVAVHGNYLAGAFVGRPANRSNGAMRSSRINVVCWLSDRRNASMRSK